MRYFVKIIVAVIMATHLTSGGSLNSNVFEKNLKTMDDAPQGGIVDPSGWYDSSYASWRGDGSPTHWQYKNQQHFLQYEPFFEATYDALTPKNGFKSNGDRHNYWHHHHTLPIKKSNNWYNSHGRSYFKPSQNFPSYHPYLDHRKFGQFKPFPVPEEHQSNKDNFYGPKLREIDEHYPPIKIPSSPQNNPIHINPVKISTPSSTTISFVEPYYILPSTTTVKSPVYTLPPITPPQKRPNLGTQERTTRSPLQIAQCVRSCPVTSEFNPVCGSNNITYANPGRLDCAQFCGVDVQLKSKSSCTAIIPEPTQTQMPTVAPMKPTRWTIIHPPSPTGEFTDTTTSSPVTISQDILNSIFTTTSADDNYDIDIRTRAKFFPPQYVYPVPEHRKGQ